MAQKGAHLTTNISTKPSLFEIIAQDSLDSTLEPALRRIIQVYLCFKIINFTFSNSYMIIL